MQLKATEPNISQQRANRQDQPTTQKTHEQEYNFQYYEQYKRLYQTAYYLSLQMKQLTQAKEDLWAKLLRMEKKTEQFKDDIRGEAPEKKKRSRRTAEQIQRQYICSVQRCQKCYGSEGSLQQHIKLKHPQLYQSRSPHPNQSNSQL